MSLSSYLSFDVQKLSLGLKPQPQDALQLSVLTGLTGLEFMHVGDGVDDYTAVTLACELAQLKCLKLAHCKLDAMTCIPAIARLGALTSLNIRFCDGMTDRHLQALSRLTSLRELRLTRTQVSREAAVQFATATGVLVYHT